MERMLCLKDVADLLGICTRTVWRLVQRGELPRPVKIGAASRWVYSELCAYIQRISGLRPAGPTNKNP